MAIRTLMLVLAAGLLLSACGGDSANSDRDSREPTSDPGPDGDPPRDDEPKKPIQDLGLLGGPSAKLKIELDGANEEYYPYNRLLTEPVFTSGFTSAVIYVHVDSDLMLETCYLSREGKKELSSVDFDDLKVTIHFGMKSDRLYKSNKQFVVEGSSILELPSLPGSYMALELSPEWYAGSRAPRIAPDGEDPEPVEDTTPFCQGKIEIDLYGTRSSAD